MSTFDDAFDAYAAPDLRSEFGTSFEYTSQGAEESVSGIGKWEALGVREIYLDGGNHSVPMGELEIDLDVISEPAPGDTLEMDSKTWVVHEIAHLDEIASECTLILRRFVRGDVSGRGFGRDR